MSQHMISVIVPVYNTKEYLNRCMNSICNQTYDNLEIIAVDDGSTDGSGNVCDQYAKSDQRVRVVHQVNGGLPAARRTGLKTATADFVTFVDSDDWIEPDMIETLWKSMEEYDTDISVGRQFLDNGFVSHVEAERSIVKGCLSHDEIPHHIIYSDDYSHRGISPNFWDKLFKKELIVRHQYSLDLNTKYGEDDICVFGTLLDSKRVVVSEKPVYHYCRREGSMTSYGDDEYFAKITLFYQQMKRVFEAHEQSELLMKKLDRYMLEFVLRGINKSFGFGFGNVVPFFSIPYNALQQCVDKRIVLYGAGEVGKDYYTSLKRSGFNIVTWIDKRGAELHRLGFNTEGIDAIKRLSYDVILLAADSKDLMDQMKHTLVKDLGVDVAKIVAEYPVKLIEQL